MVPPTARSAFPPLSAILILGTLAGGANAADPAGGEFFEKKIRPLLAAHCQKCHGPAKPKAGLRLDSRAGLLAGGDSGPAVKPGDPEGSRLIEAVRYTGDLKMPPKGKLNEEQIADLTAWVKSGVPWPEVNEKVAAAAKAFNLQERAKRHWAWQPVRAVAPPRVQRTDWPTSPIDQFLLAKLEAAGLHPAPPADRRTWLRRVTFDLIGLPPAPAEIDAFLADDSPRASAKVVERLLASPHYGERWARHWLDLVRWAETCGHEFDVDLPDAWRYRDYAVRAFNDDLPYDRFVIEHVAGDLLPEPRRHPVERWNESILATGFWFLGESKHSPVDIRQDEAERIDNQLDVFGKTFLGLTLGCARCHDHKFDAISTKDYYALCGFLQSSRFQRAFIDEPGPTRETVRQLRQVASQARAAALPTTARHLHHTLAQHGWVAALRKTGIGRTDPLVSAWLTLADPDAKLTPPAFTTRLQELVRNLHAQAQWAEAAEARADRFEDFDRNSFAGWFVSGAAFGDRPSIAEDLTFTAGERRPIERLVGPGLAHSGLMSPRLQGVLRSRTFRIDKDRILYRLAGKQAQVRLIMDGFQQIRAPIYGGLEFAVDHGERLDWRAQDVRMWKGHTAYIELVDDSPAGYLAVDQILFSDEGPPPPHPNRLLMKLLGDPALTAPEVLTQKSQDLLRAIVEQWRTGRLEKLADAGDRTALLNLLLQGDGPALGAGIAAAWKGLSEQRNRLENQLAPPRRALAMLDGTGENERVFIRGNHKNLGEEVPRRFLEAIAGRNQPAPKHGSGRLELARRLVDPANPLTARVMVNRLWRHHFEEGIVRSPDDFGVQGQVPTHPELLAWLAAEFVRRGWSIKEMHRLIVLSSAYRMASQSNPPAATADPQNRLLHRMPLRRLEAECIRDALLAVSGRLDRTMEGPGVPPHLTPFMIGRGRPAAFGPLDGAGRRSLYLNVRRNFLNPMFLAFDYPTPFTTMGRRSVSNVPAQALALMNNPFVVQQAERWARRVLAEPGRTAEQRVTAMYLAAFGRPPRETELADALRFLHEPASEYGKVDDVRAWADLAHVLVNVKEFIFVN